MLRRIAVVSLLCLASAIASVWQPAPRTPRSVTNIVKIVPAIFTTSFAQAPVTTSCSGTPTPNDPLLGGQSGVLAIQMNSLKLVSSTSTEVSLLSSPKDLNFGLSSGSSAGSFASNVAISAGTYVQLKAVMDNTFRIMCAVTCDTDGAGPIASRTFVTKGGSA